MKYIRLDIEWNTTIKAFVYNETPISGDRVFKTFGETFISLPSGISVYAPEDKKIDYKEQLIQKLLDQTEESLAEAKHQAQMAAFLSIDLAMEQQFINRGGK